MVALPFVDAGKYLIQHSQHRNAVKTLVLGGSTIPETPETMGIVVSLWTPFLAIVEVALNR